MKQYSWERVAEKTYELYQQVMTSARSAALDSARPFKAGKINDVLASHIDAAEGSVECQTFSASAWLEMPITTHSQELELKLHE